MIDALSDFHFLRPWWLVGLGVFPLVVWLLWGRRHSSRTWARVCDAHLLPHLLESGGGSRSRLPIVATLVAVIIATLAMAGPSWQQRPQPVYRGGGAQVIVFDLSRSMLAADIKPSRLERARFKISDLLRDMEEGQVAMVVFAGDAFVVSPLTDDANTILALLNALTPDIMPAQGAGASRGLQLAGDLLAQAGESQGQVLLVADAVDAEAPAAAEALALAGHRVSVLAVGTRDGAPIPVEGGGFLKRANGDIVVPRLDLVAMREVAAVGGGSAVQLRADNRDLERLTAPMEWAMNGDPRNSSRNADAWREEGPWLVLLLLPLAALAFRRGWVACLALLLFSPTEPAMAGMWEDLWKRPDQQVQQALDNEEPGLAASLADDPWQLGTAQFRAGDYAAAAQAFERLATPDGHYNRGNALAKLNRLDDAIAAYEDALALAPEMEDALFNKELLEQLKEQQEQQSQQQDDQNQEESDSGDGESDSQDQEGESEEESDQQQEGSEGDEQNQDEQQSEEQQNGDEGEQSEEQRAAAEADPLSEEERQAVEQWLRRIPDDPGGLLRRKFLLQYRQRERGEELEEAW